MVKQKVREVCLDPRNPCAREYQERDIFEQVTEPDVSMSLTQMVNTGTVPSSGKNYVYPDLPDDEEAAHDAPDYEKLNSSDIVEKEQFVEQWLEKPENYEKLDQSVSDQPEPKKDNEPEPSEGE